MTPSDSDYIKPVPGQDISVILVWNRAARVPVMMKGFLLVFLAVLAARVESDSVAEDGFVPRFPAKLEESKTLKKFVKLVEEHNLNVSVLISTAEKWKDGSVREAMTLAVTLPTNNLKVKETKLDKDVAKQFLKVAAAENLSAQGVKSNLDDPQHPMTTITNNPYGWPTEKALKIAVEAVASERSFKADNFGAQFTFNVPSAAGNTTTKIYYGSLNVEVEKTQGFSQEETSAAIEAVRAGYFEYEWDDIPQVIVTHMTKKHPKDDWQVAIDVGEDSWLNAAKYLVLKNMGTLYTIFAIQ